MKSFTKVAMTPRARRLALAATTALALAFGTSAAMAQPGGHHAGGHHGMHHGGGPGDMLFGKAFMEAKASLNLNTSQQLAWDNAVAQGKAARDAARANRQKVKDVLVAELNKPEPDLAAIAAASDSVQLQNQAARKQVRDAWLALYATFTPQQKTVVRDLLQQKVARAESFHQRMIERFQERRGGTSG
jgi:Spy/CpxP family protein refolding chaperone